MSSANPDHHGFCLSSAKAIPEILYHPQCNTSLPYKELAIRPVHLSIVAVNVQVFHLPKANFTLWGGTHFSSKSFSICQDLVVKDEPKKKLHSLRHANLPDPSLVCCSRRLSCLYDLYSRLNGESKIILTPATIPFLT